MRSTETAVKKKGLSSAQAEAARKEYGSNRLSQAKPKREKLRKKVKVQKLKNLLTQDRDMLEKLQRQSKSLSLMKEFNTFLR